MSKVCPKCQAGLEDIFSENSRAVQSACYIKHKGLSNGVSICRLEGKLRDSRPETTILIRSDAMLPNVIIKILLGQLSMVYNASK
jgi:hypothetical protein